MGINMTEHFSVELSSIAGSVARHDVLVEVDLGWVVATTANLSGGLLPQAMATAAGDADTAVPVQQVGLISGVLGVGANTYATVDANGRIQRTVSPLTTDLIVGRVYANGDVGLLFPGYYLDGGGIAIQAEGTPLTTSAGTINFTGAGVTASGSGATKTVDIPGGGDVATTMWIDASLAPYSMVADSDLAGAGTDNTPKLQAAIDALPAGGTIAIPFGAYRLGPSAGMPGIAIQANKRVRFVGVGAGQNCYGTTLVCDAGVTGFYNQAYLGQDASWEQLAIISASKDAGSSAVSWNGTTHTATVGGGEVAKWKTGQIIRIRGGAGMVDLPATAVQGASTIGPGGTSALMRLSGPGRYFAVGDYLTMGASWPTRTRVLAKNLASTVWAVNTAYPIHTYRVPTVSNSFVYEMVYPPGGGTSDMTTEPTWPTALGLEVADNGMIWRCICATTEPVTLTMASESLASEGTYYAAITIAQACDVSGRIVSGGGTTALVLDNYGVQGNGSFSYLPTYPWTGTATTTDAILEHHDCGIYSPAISKVSDCTLGTSGHGFQGCGIAFRGGTADIGFGGNNQNADFSRITDCWSFECYHAMEGADTDANRIKADQFKSVGSISFAFYDMSALGMTFDNCHASGLGFFVGMTANGQTFLNNCYCEGGSVSYCGIGAVQVGAGIPLFAGATVLSSQACVIPQIGNIYGASRFTTHQLNLNQNRAWEEYYSSDGSAQYALQHRKTNTPNDGFGALGFHAWAHTTVSAGLVRYSWAVADEDAPSGTRVGAMWIPEMFYVGGGGNAGAGNVPLVTALTTRTAWTWGAAAPTAGTWKKGDRCYNDGSVAQVVDFWYCTVGGTGGGATWVASNA